MNIRFNPKGLTESFSVISVDFRKDSPRSFCPHMGKVNWFNLYITNILSIQDMGKYREIKTDTSASGNSPYRHLVTIGVGKMDSNGRLIFFAQNSLQDLIEQLKNSGAELY